MSDAISKVGSVWRRWDLHLHAPGTKLSNGFGDADEATMKAYVEELEESDVQVFGITDYFSFDSYLAVKTAYKAAYPNGAKLFIPNIEFRLTETISGDGRNVHTHVLIDPKAATDDKLNTLLSDLFTHITRDSGEEVRCKDLKSEADYMQATVGIKALKGALSKVFPDETAYIIVTAANNDGLRGVDSNSPRSLSISDELDKASHGFFGSSKNTGYFLTESRYEGETNARKKPVYTGSDAHSFDDLKRLSGDEQGYEATWIKADLTFRGLRQTLFEPKGRVHIGERPTVLERLDRDATRFIAKLRVDQVPGYNEANGSWFKDVTIPFNPELTAIIGNKGSGKSAIADILGLLGESRQSTHFSFLTDDPKNRKFRRKGYAENFEAEVTWASGDTGHKKLDEEVGGLKTEKVKYLPQNYFESLTNEIEVKAFRREIEEVVFSHVDDSERMGKASFSELEDLKTSQSRTDISVLKAQLRQLNIEIVALEEQADPDTKARLLEELKQLNKEYGVLEKSKPQVVEKPETETEEQRAITVQIEQARETLAEIVARGKQAVERLATLKTDLVDLGSLKDSLASLASKVTTEIEGLRAACKRFNLDIDAIVNFNLDTSGVDEKISAMQAEVKLLEALYEKEITDETDLKTLSSVPALRKAHDFLKYKLVELQDTLSAPQKRYQRYVQAMSEVTVKMYELMGGGENPKPGTIRHLEGRIKYIDEELSAKIEVEYESRDKLSQSIFEEKKKVRQFYEGLKSSVEKRLELVRRDEHNNVVFDVTIDASFVPSHEFVESFFELLNQAATGPFRGAVQGQAELDSRMSEINWNDAKSVLAFAKSIIASIKEQDIGRQVKDVKRLYDLLFSFDYFSARYELRLSGKNLNQLSPGEKGLLLLVFYLHLDMEKTPLIIDQPEDNLDNDSIFSVLARCIRQAKKSRQIILVTHNPNLAVGADAEQILYVSLDKAGGYKFACQSGSIENPKINDLIVKILEGSRPAFVQRRLAYHIE